MSRIISLSINFLIFSLPFGVLFRITLIPNLSFYPHDFFAGTIFLFAVYQFLFKRKPSDLKKTLTLLTAFLAIGLISLLLNFDILSPTHFFVSFSYLVRYAAYFSILFSLQFLGKDFLASVPLKLVISGYIFMFLGFIQYLYYNDLRNLYYLGWDEHLYRLFSTFLDPNFAGTLLVLLAILTFGYAVNIYHKKRRVSLLLFGLLILDFIAILLTYSRSALIMLVVGMIVLFALNKKNLLLFVLLLTIVISYLSFANTSIEGLNPLRMASVEARIDSAKEALRIIGDNPLLGVGFNAYRYAQLDYGFRTEIGTAKSNADAGTDNSYLFVLATTGIVGFLIFVYLWFSLLKLLLVKLRNDKTYLSFVAIASLAGLFVNTIFINSIFYTPILVWILLLIGVTVSKRR